MVGLRMPWPNIKQKTKMPSRQVQRAGDSSRQIDAAAARKILGLIGRNYSDAQLEEALALLRGLSELVYHHLETGKYASGSPSQDE